MTNDPTDTALKELAIVRSTWQKNFEDISQDNSRQMSVDEANRIRVFFHSEADRLRIFYNRAYQDSEFRRQIDSFSNEFGAKLEIALLNCERRFENTSHQQKIESLNAWGSFLKNVGVNIGILLLGILGTFFGIKFSGFCP